jgi:hypothetical protein
VEVREEIRRWKMGRRGVKYEAAGQQNSACRGTVQFLVSVVLPGIEKG